MLHEETLSLSLRDGAKVFLEHGKKKLLQLFDINSFRSTNPQQNWVLSSEGREAGS